MFSHSQSSDVENREAFNFLLYAFFDKSTAVGREISSIFAKNSAGKTVRESVGAVGAELNFFAGIGDLDISELASGNVGDKLTSIRYNPESEKLEGPAVEALSEKYPLPVLTYMLHSGANMRIPKNISEVQKFLTTNSDTFFPKDKQHIDKV